MVVRVERSGAHVMLVCFDRPQVRNAWNQELVDCMHEVWTTFAADDTYRCCVVTGAGPMFTAGLDLKQPPSDGAPAMPNLSVPCDKPIIAAVEGAAIGFGSVFCQLADMVFAGRSAYFLYPEAKLGLVQGMMAGFPGRLQYKGGLQWLLSADPISADRAREIGLINEVCDDGQALHRALEMAEKISKNAPLVVQAMKAIALGSVPKGPMEANYRINRLIAQVATSEDGQAGLAAFRERRQAEFRGR
jgi:enoyl-CoA hydratase